MRLHKKWALLLALFYTSVITLFLTWASLDVSIFALPTSLTSAPWFITTCVDAWMGLFMITLWTWSFERSWPKRFLWFALIMGLGNVGVGLYLIKRTLAMPQRFSLQDFYTKNTNQGQENHIPNHEVSHD